MKDGMHQADKSRVSFAKPVIDPSLGNTKGNYIVVYKISLKQSMYKKTIVHVYTHHYH